MDDELHVVSEEEQTTGSTKIHTVSTDLVDGEAVLLEDEFDLLRL